MTQPKPRQKHGGSAPKDKRLRKLYRDVLRPAGWKYEIRRSGHAKFISPTGRPVFVSLTCSDHRAYHRIMKTLRDAGAKGV